MGVFPLPCPCPRGCPARREPGGHAPQEDGRVRDWWTGGLFVQEEVMGGDGRGGRAC